LFPENLPRPKEPAGTGKGNLVAALRSGTIVPIHTFAPERFRDLFGNVVLLQDGQAWSLRDEARPQRPIR
jgi:hypothetical protein